MGRSWLGALLLSARSRCFAFSSYRVWLLQLSGGGRCTQAKVLPGDGRCQRRRHFCASSSSLEASSRVVSLCPWAPGENLDLSISGGGDALASFPSWRRHLRSLVSSSGLGVAGWRSRRCLPDVVLALVGWLCSSVLLALAALLYRNLPCFRVSFSNSDGTALFEPERGGQGSLFGIGGGRCHDNKARLLW